MAVEQEADPDPCISLLLQYIFFHVSCNYGTLLSDRGKLKTFKNLVFLLHNFPMQTDGCGYFSGEHTNSRIYIGHGNILPFAVNIISDINL